MLHFLRGVSFVQRVLERNSCRCIGADGESLSQGLKPEIEVVLMSGINPGPISEARARAGIPEAKARAGIPEAKARAGIPEARARAGIPEAKARAGIPEAKARAGISEAKARAGTNSLYTYGKFSLRTRAAWFAVLLAVALPSAWAKDVPITGVLLYPTASGYGYVQVTGFLVNGKTELRACSGNGLVDKSVYKNMAKISLATVKTLERMPDGTLVADVGSGAAICVVPGNFKFERDGAMKAADLVDKSAYGGQVLGSSPA